MRDEYTDGDRYSRSSRAYGQQPQQRRRLTDEERRSSQQGRNPRSDRERSTRPRSDRERDSYERTRRPRNDYERSDRDRRQGQRSSYDRDGYGRSARQRDGYERSARQRQSQRQRNSYGDDRSRSGIDSPLAYVLQNKKLLIAIAAAVVLIIIIAFAARGCGSGDDNSQNASSSPAASTASNTSANATSPTSGTSQDVTSPASTTESASETSPDATSPDNANSNRSEVQTTTASKLDTELLISGAEAAAALGNDARKGDFSISFATTGDIMFAREVGNFVEENGGAAALANVASELSAADVTIANLECPLTDDESEALYGKDVLWRSNPKGIDALTSAGIDLVSLANNHIMDYGGVGLSDTLTALDDAGILHAGAGMTEEDAAKMAELNVGNISIAFLSWTDIVPDYFISYDDNPGVVSARLNMEDACNRVREAKKNHDIVIVAMHWGVEYQDYIDEYLQQNPGHELVDAGADVVWGNHPHVIEGIELYNGSLISYSQGDFVCDHYSRETGESFILTFDITRDGITNIVATPVYLDDENGIPNIVHGEDAANILERLEQISEGMNTTFELKDDKAYIS